MGYVDLDESGVRDLADNVDADRPIVMLNLLRYRDQADYSGHPDQTSCSGREAYKRYSELVIPMVEKIGATVKVAARCKATLVGAPGEVWDDMLLVEYPSRGVFEAMARSDAYQKVAIHRQAALADSRLIALQTGSASFQD